MKASIIKYSLITMVIVVTGFTIKQNDDLHQAMMRMMEKMKSIKMSGDPDHDFAMMMVEHHQGSIDMSKIAVSSAKTEKIKSIAQNILNKQPQEQQELRTHKMPGSNDHAAHHGDQNSASSDFSNAMNQSMREMESKMNNMKMTKDLDKDYAMMMIPHHESAIQMADAVIRHGKDKRIKLIAENIKSDSQKEVRELKSWLTEYK